MGMNQIEKGFSLTNLSFTNSTIENSIFEINSVNDKRASLKNNFLRNSKSQEKLFETSAANPKERVFKALSLKNSKGEDKFYQINSEIENEQRLFQKKPEIRYQKLCPRFQNSFPQISESSETTFQVVIRLFYETYLFLILKPKVSIQEIKDMIEQNFLIPKYQQILMVDSKILDNRKSIQFYSIQKYSEIKLKIKSFSKRNQETKMKNLLPIFKTVFLNLVNHLKIHFKLLLDYSMKNIFY
jgi:hypothetical protein